MPHNITITGPGQLVGLTEDPPNNPVLPDLPPTGTSGSTNPPLTDLYPDLPGFNPFLHPSDVLGIGGASRAALSRVATPLPEVQQSCVATGALLPLAYGRVRLGMNMGFPFVHNGLLYFPAFWCEGEIDSITIYINDELADWQVGDLGIPENDFEHYYGSSDQEVSPFAASEFGYPDAHPNVAYSWIELGPAFLPEDIVAEVRGRKIYDPRLDSTAGGSGSHRVDDPSTWEYSANPSLITADFHQKYRLGRESINWESVAECADRNDEDLDPPNGIKRSEVGLVFSRRRPFETYFETLKDYASVFHHYDGDTLVLVPDAPTPVSVYMSTKDIVKGSLNLDMTSADDTPDQVIVQYTNTNVTPWSEEIAATEMPEGGAKNPQILPMPGFQSHQQAKRYAVNRLNKFNLIDLQGTFKVFDEGLKLVPGDVISLTHDRGLANKKLRVIDSVAYDLSRYLVQVAEYQENQYSDVIESEPDWDDTNIPSPSDFPTVTGLSASERLWQDHSGIWHTVFDVSFSGTNWPHVREYRVQVTRTQNGQPLYESVISHQGTGPHVFTTPPSQQGVEWEVKVWVVNVYGNHDPDVYASKTVVGNGNTIPPLDVPAGSLSSIEFGQFVELTWGASGDTNLLGYKIKRLDDSEYQADLLAGDDPWENVNSVVVQERVDAQRDLIPNQPVGTYWYGVKAFDRTGLYSVNAAWVRQVVTADGSGGLSSTKLDVDLSTADNVYAYEVYGVGTRVMTYDGGSWEDRLGGGKPWPVDETEPWLHGMEVESSSITSETWDTDLDRSVHWYFSPKDIRVYGGANVQYTTETAAESAYPTFTEHAGQTAVANARYMRGKVSLVTNDNVVHGGDNVVHGGDNVVFPADTEDQAFAVLFKFDASHQGEIQTDEVVASVPASPQPYAFTWNANFVEKPSYSFVVESTEPRIVAFDSVDKDGGLIRVWDENFNAADADVIITAEGP